MQRSLSRKIEAPAASVFGRLGDLGSYSEWMPLVTTVRDNSDGSYEVTLAAKIGPLSRSKKLRMIKTSEADQHADPRTVSYERAENLVDGKFSNEGFANWKLHAEVAEVSDSDSKCEVTIEMFYDGSLWSDSLGFILDKFMADAADDLARVARGE